MSEDKPETNLTVRQGSRSDGSCNFCNDYWGVIVIRSKGGLEVRFCRVCWMQASNLVRKL